MTRTVSPGRRSRSRAQRPLTRRTKSCLENEEPGLNPCCEEDHGIKTRIARYLLPTLALPAKLTYTACGFASRRVHHTIGGRVWLSPEKILNFAQAAESVRTSVLTFSRSVMTPSAR